MWVKIATENGPVESLRVFPLKVAPFVPENLGDFLGQSVGDGSMGATARQLKIEMEGMEVGLYGKVMQKLGTTAVKMGTTNQFYDVYSYDAVTSNFFRRCPYFPILSW